MRPTPTRATVLPATRSMTSGDALAGPAGQVEDPLGVLTEDGRRQRLWAVAERVLGVGMRFDEHAVRTRRDPGQRQGQHEVEAAGRVAGVDDHGQMTGDLDHGHGADVEGVARGRLKGPDAALTEDDVAKALFHHVLGGHQELFDRRRGAALEQHRPAEPAQFGQKQEVLGVARPDLEHVGVRAHDVQVARVHDLGDDGQAGLVAGGGQHLEALLAETLERVGRRARFEGAAAHHVAAGRLDGAGGGQHLLRRLDRTRAGDDREVAAADLRATHLDHRVALLELATDELVGFEDRDDAVHTGHRLQRERRDVLAVTDHADDRDTLAGRDMRSCADLFDPEDDVGDLRLGRALHHDDHHTQLEPPSTLTCLSTSSSPILLRKNSVSISVPTVTRTHPGHPKALPSRTIAPRESSAPQTFSWGWQRSRASTSMKFASVGTVARPRSASCATMAERTAALYRRRHSTWS